MSGLTAPVFLDSEKAREYFERLRWPNGPVCPHCGGNSKIYKMLSKSARAGLYKCGACRKQFTVTVDTMFEGSRVPLNSWLIAVHLLCSRNQGVTIHQLQKSLGVSYKTAWYLAHRIREAIKSEVESGMIDEDDSASVLDTYLPAQ